MVRCGAAVDPGDKDGGWQWLVLPVNCVRLFFASCVTPVGCMPAVWGSTERAHTITISSGLFPAGYTPLHMAAGYLHTTTVTALLQAGADPEQEDAAGRRCGRPLLQGGRGVELTDKEPKGTQPHGPDVDAARRGPLLFVPFQTDKTEFSHRVPHPHPLAAAPGP